MSLLWLTLAARFTWATRFSPDRRGVPWIEALGRRLPVARDSIGASLSAKLAAVLPFQNVQRSFSPIGPAKMTDSASGQIDHVLIEERLFPPSADFTAKAVISSMQQYEDLYRRARMIPNRSGVPKQRNTCTGSSRLRMSANGKRRM